MAREMSKKRLNPGYAHARHSGEPSAPYPLLPLKQWLSPLWFESFSAALAEAEKAGTTLGYCDEYWWPSGQAGGRVLEKSPELAAQSLEWQRQVYQGPENITLPQSKFTVAAKLKGDDLIDSNTLKIIGQGPAFKWAVPEGKWVVYTYTLYHHSGVDGGEVNYLNPLLMDVFIPIAHESYQNNFGERMGHSIPGVFVDNEGDYGWKMAWSEYLAKRYNEMKNQDIRLWMPLLTEIDDQGIWVKARYDWFDTVSEVYSNQFLKRLNDWLAERNMYYISNLWEETLMLQTRAVGDFMRAQRSVSLPGNDCLQMKSQQVHDFKETQSVCEFEDRPFMSELMGVAGWEQTPVQMKQTLNAVTAWGITHTVPHGINLNRKLETIPYPADWFTENPYWRYIQLWTDFARRASFVNRQGRLVANVLLVNPLESVWALSEGYFTSVDGNRWPEKVIEINDTYSDAMNTLTRSRLDYLIADRHYMKMAVIEEAKKDQKAVLKIKDHGFQVLVLPPMFVLSRKTAEKILNFAQTGGCVILLGELPQGSPEQGADDQLIKEQMKKLLILPSVINLAEQEDKMIQLPQKIEQAINPQIRVLKGDIPLIVSHRSIDNNDFYWLSNNSNRQQDLVLSLRDGQGRAEIWNCESGSMIAVPYGKADGRKIIQLDFDPYQAYWLVFDSEAKPATFMKPEQKHIREMKISDKPQMYFPETNTIKSSSAKTFITSATLAHTEFLDVGYDDSLWQWRSIVGRINLSDDWRATMLYIPEPESKRYYRYEFVLEDDPESALININADNKVRFWVNAKPVKPGIHAATWANVDLHDIAPLLRKGKNLIAVEATNDPGFGWLLVQGTVQLPNGTVKEILTSRDWKESKTASKGWYTLEFDDTSWENAMLASEERIDEDMKYMKAPQKVAYTKSAVWWRMGIPPGAKKVTLPSLSKMAQVWIDGQKATVDNDTLLIPDAAHLLVIKNMVGENGLAQPAEFTCQGSGAGDYGSWLDFGLRSFTGFVDYEVSFDRPENANSVKLDLGKVLHMAEVWLNDKKVGERLWPPFTFDLTYALQSGDNKLRIRVGNLMVNAMGLKDDIGELRHWGWEGTPPDSCFDAGLFGPVRILVEE